MCHSRPDVGKAYWVPSVAFHLCRVTRITQVSLSPTTMSAAFPGYPSFAYQASYVPYITAPGQTAPVPFPAQFSIPGYPILYGLPPPKAPSASNQHPVAPDIPGLSQEIASSQLQKLIVSHLKQSQFKAIESRALLRLELEVVACKGPYQTIDKELISFSQSYKDSSRGHMNTPILPIERLQ